MDHELYFMLRAQEKQLKEIQRTVEQNREMIEMMIGQITNEGEEEQQQETTKIKPRRTEE